LKIGLNTTCINQRPSGAQKRLVGIYGELIKLLPEVEFVVYEPSDCRVGAWFEGSPNVSVRRTPLPSDGRIRRFLVGIGYWNEVLSKEKFDFFECFNQPLVKAPIGRTLLTIHDVRRIQTEWSGWDRMVYKLALERDLRTADHVITVSQTMKEEILRFFPGVSISVIYNGLESYEFDSVNSIDMHDVRQKYQLPNEFVLAVGHYEKRKNYLHLIDAMARLRDRGFNYNLVIVGNDSGEGEAMEERVHSANLKENVKLLRGLADLEVRCVYKLCSLFAFPSSYEGFGIPILEAMAAGCPMVLSDIPVFREITEGRGIYFPHNDSEAMADAIHKVMTSNYERERQTQYGYERVLAFNFKSLASQLADVYRANLNG
jgi:glycosyltransferase involved in cell wall biosynthesis